MYIPESITFLNCQHKVSWPCVTIIIAAAITKDCNYRNNCGFRLHAGDLEHSLLKEKNRFSYVFFSFLCSAIPHLDLEVFKMLIRVCFRDVLLPEVYWFVPGMIWISTILYSKCRVFTVNICYLQVLAMYKKVLS